MRWISGIENKETQSLTQHYLAMKTRSPPSDADDSPLRRLSNAKKRSHSKKQSHTVNPFKQQDEEAVLAEKSHNRRR